MNKHLLLVISLFFLHQLAWAQFNNGSFEQSDSLGNTIHWSVQKGKAKRFTLQTFSGIPFTASAGNFFMQLTADTAIPFQPAQFTTQFATDSLFPSIPKYYSIDYLLTANDTNSKAVVNLLFSKWNGNKRDTLSFQKDTLSIVRTSSGIPIQWNTFNAAISCSQIPDSGWINIESSLNPNIDKLTALYIDNIVFKSWPLSITKPIAEKTFHVYPNPADNMIVLNSSMTIQKIEIINQLGEMVYSSAALSTGTIDVSQIPSGLYWLRVISEEKIQYKPSLFIISHP